MSQSAAQHDVTHHAAFQPEYFCWRTDITKTAMFEHFANCGIRNSYVVEK
jgi:hypothetical protein